MRHMFGSSILMFALATSVCAQGRALVPGGAPAQQPVASGDEGILINTDLVTLNVTVADANGNHVAGLDKSAFAVYDNQARQEITFFGDADEPVSVAIVFDVSGSMSKGKITRAKEALRRLIQASHVDDEFYLITFTSHPLLNLQRPPTPHPVASN